jgi:uncharacterized SAM-binding protein YcdF (DUF218 family)
VKILLGWVIGIVVLVVGMGFGIGAFLSPDDLRRCLREDNCVPADAVIVISGGDTNARVDEAVRLYEARLASKILVSGAAADENSPSNAQVMAERAVLLGVPEGDIILEEQARTTRENAEFSAEIAAVNGWRSVILVTSAYHQRRANLEFSRAMTETMENGGIDPADSVIVLGHPTPNDHFWGALWWATPAGWWLSLTEIVGIGAFYVR